MAKEGKKRKKEDIKAQPEEVTAKERVVEIDISEMLIGFSTKVSAVAKEPKVPLRKKTIKQEGQSTVTERKKSGVSKDLKEAPVYKASEAQVQEASEA